MNTVDATAASSHRDISTKQTRNHQQSATHYAIAVLLLSLYGGQICPFVESLTLLPFTLQVASTTLVIYYLRRHIIGTKQASQQLTYFARFQYELGFFALLGCCHGLINGVIHGFPVESSAKIFVATIAIGFFVASDLAVHYHHQQLLQLKAQGAKNVIRDRFATIAKKFKLFASVQMAVVLAIIFMMLSKDIQWLASINLEHEKRHSELLILMELSFVIVAILFYTTRIISSYARYLKFFVDNELEVLSAVSAGKREVEVPVLSNDEFARIATHTNHMVAELRSREQELNTTRDVAILGLSSLAEARDNETGAHILRTQYYVKALAEQLAQYDQYRQQLTPEAIELLFKSAPLHDVGKVGIPDAILLKPDKLTDDEFDIMKTHADIGRRAIENAEGQLGTNSFLHYAKEIAATHHEKWDGSGYPLGLQGNAIPLSGRLMALADVYDALISKRVYKAAFSHDKARQIIVDGRDKHFDPQIVDAFLTIEEQFKAIAKQYGDSHTEAA